MTTASTTFVEIKALLLSTSDKGFESGLKYIETHASRVGMVLPKVTEVDESFFNEIVGKVIGLQKPNAHKPSNLAEVSLVDVNKHRVRVKAESWDWLATSGLFSFEDTVFAYFVEPNDCLLAAWNAHVFCGCCAKGYPAKTHSKHLCENEVCKVLAGRIGSLLLPKDVERESTSPAILEINGESEQLAYKALEEQVRGMQECAEVLKFICENQDWEGLPELAEDGFSLKCEDVEDKDERLKNFKGHVKGRPSHTKKLSGHFMPEFEAEKAELVKEADRFGLWRIITLLGGSAIVNCGSLKDNMQTCTDSPLVNSLIDKGVRAGSTGYVLVKLLP